MKIIGQAITVGGEWTAMIHVSYPIGATLTCSFDGTVYTATTSTGNYLFKVHKAGTWTITATDAGQSVSTRVTITTNGQAESVELSITYIYGISRSVSSSSPSWTRTDSSVGKTATASVGNTAGASDFDNCYPWSDMVRETLSTGDIMVYIPTFYFQRYVESGIEYIRIADKRVDGFAKHPGSGRYIGAYKTSSGNVSKSGTAPMTNYKITTMRANARLKGYGWGIIDKAVESAVQMLCLVEFATNNVQDVIGRGNSHYNPDILSTGSCDSVPNLTGSPSGTTGRTDVVYRGIEGFWGNVWEWVDGIQWVNGSYLVSTDPYYYGNYFGAYHTTLTFIGAANWYESYITVEGMDNNVPWAMLPSLSGGSESTYYTDACWTGYTDIRVCARGGSSIDNSMCGLFAVNFEYESDGTNDKVGSRLMYIPY